MSCAVTRSLSLMALTLPSSTYLTPRSRPTCRMSTDLPLYTSLELRAMTKRSCDCERLVVMSSVTASASDCHFGSLLRLPKGSTAMLGLSNGGGPSGRTQLIVASAAPATASAKAVNATVRPQAAERQPPKEIGRASGRERVEI